MGWPAAHRNVGAIGRQGGLSIPGSQRMPRPYSPRSIPGRPPSGPGNDNFPWRPPPPAGRPFGRKGRAVDKWAREQVRRSPAVRRVIRFNPVFDWVWRWYVYINPEPIVNRRPNNAGWKLEQFCSPGYSDNIASWSSGCVMQTWVWARPETAKNIREWWRIYWDRPHPVFKDTYVGDPQSYWRRVSGTVPADAKLPVEWYAPQDQPRPQEYWLPAVDPFFVPPGFFQPVISPLPRQLSRYQWSTQAEGNWSEVGPAPTRRPRAAQENVYAKTPPGTKERKTKVRRAAVFLLRQAYKATEAVDAIEALHDGVGSMPSALPKEYRAKSGKIQDKAEALYRHWDKIDVEQAVLNLAANQFLDLLVGVPQGKAQEWATERGIFLGGGVTGARGI